MQLGCISDLSGRGTEEPDIREANELPHPGQCKLAQNQISEVGQIHTHLPAGVFNPIERLWLLLKDEWFSDYIAKNKIALQERITKAVMWVLGRAEANRQTCTIKTEL